MIRVIRSLGAALGVCLVVLSAGDFSFGGSVVAPLTPEEEQIVESLLEAPSVPAVPDENNAALVYRRVFELFERDEDVYFGAKGDDRGAVASGKKSALESGMPEPIPVTKEGEESQTTGYEILHRAEEMECNFNINWSKGPDAELIHLRKMRSIARLLAFQARFDLEQGRPERALKHYRLILVLSRHLSGEPPAISSLVALALESIGRQHIMTVAFERRDEPGFLKAAAGLLRSRPRRKKSVADAIRSDCRIMGSYYTRLAERPEMTANAFTEELAILLQSASQTQDEGTTEEPQLECRGDALRHRFEQALGLPSDSFNDETFRPIVKKMAVFHVREGDKFADAVEEGFEAAFEAARELDKKEKREWPGIPESYLARACLTPRRYPSVFAKLETADRTAPVILEAMARGDREIGVILDPFGKPYRVTWFENTAYFESPSQWDEPHDMDFYLGRYMTFETYQERIEAEKPSGDEETPEQ